jgi:hypothetical protein
MISDKTIKQIMDAIFLEPQEILGAQKNKDRKMEKVHLISIRLLSATPLKGRGCKIDPVILKIGFTDFNKEIEKLTNEDLNQILGSLKTFDDNIGTWTIIHDIASTEEHPQWRLSSDISPINCLNISLEKTAELPSRSILCIDCEGVGIFMGKPNDKKD